MSMTILSLCEAYLRHRRLAEKTRYGYRRVAAVFERDTRIRHGDEVTLESVLAWREQVLDRATATTWNTYLRHMRAIFNLAVRNGQLESNPFLEVDLVRTARKRKKVIDDEAIQFYRRALEQEPCGWFWWCVTLTFYYTGIRRRQLAGLRWSDLDLEADTLLLRSETSKNLREWTIPVMPPLAKELRALREKTRAVAGHGYLLNGQIFNITLFNHAYRGDRLTTDQISGFYQRLKEKHGHKHLISPHRFRHRFATELVRRAPVRYVQELLGHTSLATTMEYVEVDMEDLRRAASQLPPIPDGSRPDPD